LEATVALRRVITQPLAVNTAFACDGELSDALTSWTGIPGLRTFVRKPNAGKGGERNHPDDEPS
jgi:hypothetical protein